MWITVSVAGRWQDMHALALLALWQDSVVCPSVARALKGAVTRKRCLLQFAALAKEGLITDLRCFFDTERRCLHAVIQLSRSDTLLITCLGALKDLALSGPAAVVAV